MVEYNIHSILRAQESKPVEIDQFDVSLLGGLLAPLHLGMGDRIQLWGGGCKVSDKIEFPVGKPKSL